MLVVRLANPVHAHRLVAWLTMKALHQPRPVEQHPHQRGVAPLRLLLLTLRETSWLCCHAHSPLSSRGMFPQLLISHRGPFAPSALPELIATSNRSDFLSRTAARSLFRLADNFGPPYPSRQN